MYLIITWSWYYLLFDCNKWYIIFCQTYNLKFDWHVLRQITGNNKLLNSKPLVLQASVILSNLIANIISQPQSLKSSNLILYSTFQWLEIQHGRHLYIEIMPDNYEFDTNAVNRLECCFLSAFHLSCWCEIFHCVDLLHVHFLSILTNVAGLWSVVGDDMGTRSGHHPDIKHSASVEWRSFTFCNTCPGITYVE